jgi:hypothetical protein
VSTMDPTAYAFVPDGSTAKIVSSYIAVLDLFLNAPNQDEYANAPSTLTHSCPSHSHTVAPPAHTQLPLPLSHCCPVRSLT